MITNDSSILSIFAPMTADTEMFLFLKISVNTIAPNIAKKIGIAGNNVKLNEGNTVSIRISSIPRIIAIKAVSFIMYFVIEFPDDIFSQHK